MPKSNMYQSLHTTVLGPEGRPLEIQIRTRDMHRTAQYGIAAHWRYKESPKQKEAADLAWLGQMMDWLKDLADPREFMEGLRIDLSGGRVFVFTPKGDVTNLPAGRHAGRLRLHDPHRGRPPHDRRQGERQARALGLRTAHGRFRRHPHVQGAGRGPEPGLAAVRGDAAGAQQDPPVVRARPPRGRARSGKELLQRQMRKQNLPFKRLATDEVLEQVVADLNYPDLDALYVAVGEGHVSPQSVVARLARRQRHRRRGRHRRRAARAAGADLGRPTCPRASWSRASPTSG